MRPVLLGWLGVTALSAVIATAAAAGCGSSSSTNAGTDGGNPAGCPAATPASGAQCSPPGLQCSYGCNVTATCNGGTWNVVASAIPCGGTDATIPDAGGGDANGCGANLATDPKNCGACGHDCLGGGCSAGKCQSVSIPVGIQGTETIDDFAIDATSIYFLFTSNTADHSVRKIPLAGGSPAVLVDLTTSTASAMFVDASSVYWFTTNDTLQRVPLAGGSATTVGAVEAGDGPITNNFAAGAGAIYWGETHITGSTTTPWLWTMSLGDGGARVLAPGEMVDLNSAVAVDPAYVYYSAGGVKKVPIGGGTPVLLAMAGGTYVPSGMAVDATHVYWVEEYGAPVRVPLAGGVPDPFVMPSANYDNNGGGARIAIDASWVYWSTPGSSSPGLWKAPIGGGAAVELAKVTKLQTPRNFAVDPVAIYWADGANFYRLAL